jgi:hypothetical protein
VRHFVLYILLILAISVFSCKDKVICPAFQSTYILNDSIRMAKFSMFGTDSMPKYQVASRRNKFGLNKDYGLFERQRKAYDLWTTPKKNVLGPPAKDPLFILEEDLIAAEIINNVDSLGIDSLQSDSVSSLTEFLASADIPENTGPKYKYRYNPKYSYNHEQEYYNKYFGHLFIDNRPPPEKEAELDFDAFENDSLSVKKKKQFVPGMFKKKKKKISGAEEEPKEAIEAEATDPEIELEEEEEGGN